MYAYEEASMLKHLLGWLAVLGSLAAAVVLPGAPAEAADFRTGDAVIVASGDVVDDDLYIASGEVVVNGTVNGDVLCVGSTVTINGRINGSLTAVGGTVVVGGEVTHAVRVAGETVDIRGVVGKDVLVAGGNINVATAANIGRDLAFAATKIRVDGLIEDGITGHATNADLGNRVGGDVEIGVGERLTIETTADIGGDLVYRSKNEAVIQPGARIGGGTTTRKIPAEWKPVFPLFAEVWLRVIAFLMTLVTGGLIVLLAPRRASSVAASLTRRPWHSLGWGAVIFCAVPVAAVIALITVVGFPAGMIGLGVYAVALYLTQIASGVFIGYWILGRFGKVESRSALLGAFALGFTLLTLLKLIPYLGGLIGFASVLFGLGAMALSQRRSHGPSQPEVVVAA